SVARTENLLDATNGLGSENHRGDGLRAADAINLRGAGVPGRVEDRRVDLAAGIARSADDDFAAAGHVGKGNGHQRRGSQGGRAARNVNADALEGIELFANERSVAVAHLPAFSERTARK